MAEDTGEFAYATRVGVEQMFKSKFGIFNVIQDVYVVEEEDGWKIVWEF